MNTEIFILFVSIKILKSINYKFIKYSRGLKYILSNFINSQKEIEDFVGKCKQNEDLNGYIKKVFLILSRKKIVSLFRSLYKFCFRYLKKKTKIIDILLGDYKVSVSKEQNLFRPV